MERKLLSLILALVMVLGVFSPVFAEETVEATEAKPAGNEAVDFLKEQGIIKGDNKGDLLLDQDIDRAQFAAILTRAAGKEDTAQAVAKLGNRFPDIAASHWANGYANVAFESGWMKGNEKGEFMPEKNISFAEIATTLVRYLNIDTAGYSYPTSYIAKAIELGLFKDVSIQNDYQANAPRKEVFQMLYNAISKDDFGKYNVYKMIVLENSRVAQIGDTKIKAEVVSVVQIANNVGERGTAKVGEQMVFDLKDTKYDVENLLGKVANFTVNEKDELVKVEIDNTFEYLNGEITKKEEKTLGIDWIDYSARVDERYYEYGKQYRSDRDDRVYRTYLTDDNYEPGSVFAKNYNYEDFAKNAEANYARITVKDGMVLFVDAYNLRDIAPVQKVEREGKDVYYYSDARNGGIERMTPTKEIVTFSEKEGFKRANRSTIKADDVIHWMDGFTLVRTDAPVTAKLERTYIDISGEWAVLEGKDNHYYLNSKYYSEIPFRSVYAYDDQHYRTLNERQELIDMVGKNVKVLLDVFGDIQLTTSDVKFNDTIGMVDRVLSSKGIQFFAPNAPEEAQYRLEDDWDSNYYRSGWNGTQTRRFDFFNRFDITYNQSEEGKIKSVAALLEFGTRDIAEKGEKESIVTGYFHRGYYRPFKYVTFTDGKRYLTLNGTEKYRYSDDTAVFVVNDIFKASKARVISKVTMEDVKKYWKSDLQAVVLTEPEFKAFLENEKIMDMKTYGRFDNREGFAKVVVFTNYKGPEADLGPTQIAKVLEVWNNYEDGYTVRLQLPNGETPVYTVINGSKKVNELDFIEYRVEKVSEKSGGASDGAIKIDKVIKFEYANMVKDELNRDYITFVGLDKKVLLDHEEIVYGDSRWNYVDVYTDGSDYATLLVFKKYRSDVNEADENQKNATKQELMNARNVLEIVENANTTKDLIDARAAYERLTDAEKKLADAVEAKKLLEYKEENKLGQAKAKALNALEALKEIAEDTSYNIDTEAKYNDAKALLETAEAYKDATGLEGTQKNNLDVSKEGYAKKVKDLVDYYENEKVDDAIKDANDDIVKARDGKEVDGYWNSQLGHVDATKLEGNSKILYEGTKDLQKQVKEYAGKVDESKVKGSNLADRLESVGKLKEEVLKDLDRVYKNYKTAVDSAAQYINDNEGK